MSSGEVERRLMAEANRASWNAATVAHNSHKADQARFLREGGSTLFPEELRLLGEVGGKRLAHLQCNAGQDSLSLAALGAEVTGVDISDEAVAFAQQLSTDSGIAATFVRSDVYDWLEKAGAGGERFDFVFSSYGALNWLDDLVRWAQGIAGVLAPRGRLVIVEFHPLKGVLETDWSLRYDYLTPEVFRSEEGVTDYVGLSGDALTPSGWRAGVEQFSNANPAFEWQHSIGEIVTAVAAAGLVVEELHEWPYANGWRGLERMRQLPGRRFAPPEDLPTLPLMLGLAARKP